MAAKKKSKARAKAVARRKPAPVKSASRKPAAKRPASRAEPQSFRARNCHAAFTVNDLARSITFYRDGLGFTIGEEWKTDDKVTGVELRAGTVELYLSQDDGARGWDRRKGVGMSLTFITAQSVDDVADRLRNVGFPLLAEPRDMPWGARAFRVADPDGFVIGIST
jgi:lactoylglutathione lyase